MAEVRQSPATASLDAELQALADSSVADLRTRWLELKGVPLPKCTRRRFITLAVAHAIQERVLGGLDPATRKRLDALVAQVVPCAGTPPPRPRNVRTGTRLIREWQGKVHEVVVTAEGFVWNGERHSSLSLIARQITGTRWNGWVFFGLKKTGAPAQGAGRRPTPMIRSGRRLPRGGGKAPQRGEAAHG